MHDVIDVNCCIVFLRREMTYLYTQILYINYVGSDSIHYQAGNIASISCYIYLFLPYRVFNARFLEESTSA